MAASPHRRVQSAPPGGFGGPRTRAIGAAFGRAADGYDAQAGVQRRAAAALAARIAQLGLGEAPRVLEIGCGTGFLTAALAAAVPGARGLATDLAPAMVARCRARIGAARFGFAVMDGERPSVAGGFDLICASLAFQWFGDLAGALLRLRALLAPGGWLAFTTLGAGSFAGWRAALAAESAAPPPPIDPMTAIRSWPGEQRITRQALDVAHGSGRAFLAALRAIGAHTPAAGQARLRVGELRRVLARFERDHAAIARYEIVFACLRA